MPHSFLVFSIKAPMFLVSSNVKRGHSVSPFLRPVSYTHLDLALVVKWGERPDKRCAGGLSAPAAGTYTVLFRGIVAGLGLPGIYLENLPLRDHHAVGRIAGDR